MSTKARGMVTSRAAPGYPSHEKTGCSSWTATASPAHPNPRLASVMPNWQAER